MLISSSGQVVDCCISCTVGLREVIVEYSTGQVASDNSLKSLRQSVNTYQVDIFAYSTSCGLDCLQSTHSHCIVVTEHNFYIITILSKSISNDLLCLILLPVTNLICQAVNFKSSILKSFYRELGTILSIYVLRITLNHDVINFTVLVQIDSIKSKISNDLALESTGLTSIATYIGNIHVLICPSLLLSCIRLTVDVYQRNVCCNYFISNGCCGRRVNRVDNHNINTLSDEVIDLSGLGSLVISTIYDFNVLSFESLALQIALQLGTEQGHEVIRELINTYTNFFVCQITIYCLSCCISGICCVCFLSCCILSSCRFGGCFFLFAAASCDYRSYHGQCKYKTYCFSFHCYSTSQMNVVTLGY